jgi:aldehyde:ferredoxin oxidoreductase
MGATPMSSNPIVESEAENFIRHLEKTHPEYPEGFARQVMEELMTEFTRAHTGDGDAWKLFNEKGEVRYEGKAKLMLGVENDNLLSNISGNCQWAYGGSRGPNLLAGRLFPERMAPFLRAATGFNYTPEMLLEVVQRTRLLQRAYDFLCGMRREDEVLADSLFEPVKTRLHGEFTLLDRDKFEQLKSEYYELRGCDPDTGAPSRKELERLGLKDVADRLQSLELKGG